MLWQRVDSYRCNECPTMSDCSFNSVATSSSAGEWVFERKDGGVGVVTDEACGFGLFVLDSEGGEEVSSTKLETCDDDDDGTLWDAEGPLPYVFGGIGIVCIFLGLYFIFKFRWKAFNPKRKSRARPSWGKASPPKKKPGVNEMI